MEDEHDWLEQVSNVLDQIVDEYGVYNYSFSYIGTWFASTHGEHILETLERIYHDSYCAWAKNPYGQTTDNERRRLRGFVAFFLIITYHIHFQNSTKIQELLEDKNYNYEFCFRDMPLLYDQISRYEKRGSNRRNLNAALCLERQAIDMLERRSCQNAGVNCSFASTVSIMLEHGQRVDQCDAERAVSLIEAAIEYNPKYAKYHYISAKLRFFLADRLCSAQDRLQRMQDAKEECMNAILQEDQNRHDYLLRNNEYKQLLFKIEEEIDCLLDKKRQDIYEYEVTVENIETFKRQILSTSNENELLRYPPANTYDGKYIFICYSHCDYKSVFCDLLEFGLQRIPFLYDRGAVLPGYDWNTAVGERIRDPKCTGIVFYLGGSSVLSNSLAEEICLVKQKAQDLGKPVNTQFFCINLTRDVPSQMLIKTIRKSRMSEIQKANLNSERIVSFLSTFTDAGDFIPRASSPMDNRHIKAVVSAIRKKFSIVPQEE